MNRWVRLCVVHPSGIKPPGRIRNSIVNLRPSLVGRRLVPGAPHPFGIIAFFSAYPMGASTHVARGSNMEAASARLTIHRVPIRCVARSERASRRTVWREAPTTRPPEPAAAASAERLQRAVGIEHLDADAGRGSMSKSGSRRARCLGCGCRRHHAALSAGSARAKPRR